MNDRYQIIQQISEDPAGVLYLAEDTMLERKVVFRKVTSDHEDERPESWDDDFAAYSGALCTSQHPNLLTIYDVSLDDVGMSIVTQFVEGESLTERLEQGPLRTMGVYHLATDLLEALHAAHNSGIYHGALHTGSVQRLPRATGGHRYLLVDLGLDTLAAMVKGEDVHMADPVFMPPELSLGETLTNVRTDLFMLGQLCYTALAGGHPFAGKSHEECIEAYRAGELPHLSEFTPEVETDFVEWIMRLCAVNVDERPATMGEAITSLHAITIDEPEPNVPGETHAVTTAPLGAGVPVTGSVAVNSAVTTNPIANLLEEERKSKNKLMIIIASLCGLIILVLVLSLARDSGEDSEVSSDDAAASSLPAIPDGVKVHLHAAELVSTMDQQDNPVLVSLETDKTLDWMVATGSPVASNKVEKEEGNYVRSILTKGDFVEYPMLNVPVQFTAGDSKMVPKPATDTKPEHQARLGEGWEMMLNIPKGHSGSAIINLYMTQLYCDFDIEITMADGKEVIKLKAPAQKPGVVKIPVEIAKPRSGRFYSIRVLAASADPEEGFTMGINAVHVESR